MNAVKAGYNTAILSANFQVSAYVHPVIVYLIGASTCYTSQKIVVAACSLKMACPALSKLPCASKSAKSL